MCIFCQKELCCFEVQFGPQNIHLILNTVFNEHILINARIIIMRVWCKHP